MYIDFPYIVPMDPPLLQVRRITIRDVDIYIYIYIYREREREIYI